MPISSATSHPSHLARELANQPEDWERAAALAGRYTHLLPTPGERTAVIGCGTSLFMARAIAALRERRGLGLTDAWPAGDHRLHRGYDRVLAVSRSGTTTEVLDALNDLAGTGQTTVITSTRDSPILELGDPIVVPEFDESSVVQSRFATSVLAMLRAHLGEDLATPIRQARQVLAESDDALAVARRAEQFTFVGMGWAAALADEAALKLRESTQSWTEAYSATEYRHGPISVSAPGRVVWAFGELVPHFARDVGVTGADLIHHHIDPMAELIRVQRLCILRAVDRDLDPDKPRNLARSVILDS